LYHPRNIHMDAQLHWVAILLTGNLDFDCVRSGAAYDFQDLHTK
jgi:hypothetical protein